MKVPTLEKAIKFIEEAEKLNPGPWIKHSYLAADCAKKIALHCIDMDPEVAYILALLHDNGRRYGVSEIRHIYDGYLYMKELGYDDVARVCLTHSFQYQNIAAYMGKIDITKQEYQFVEQYINELVYDDYDKLIQLCDAIAYPEGVTAIETRLVDVAMRRGTNEFTSEKWKAIYELKQYFEEKIGCNIYQLLDANISIETVL